MPVLKRHGLFGFVTAVCLFAVLSLRISRSRRLPSAPRHAHSERETVDLSEDGSISQDIKSVVDIDVVHRLGLRHRGVWIFVVDETQSILFVKRAETTKTCPGTWSIVGEHTHFNETWHQSVLRGLWEELKLLPEQVSLREIAPPQLLHLEYHKIGRVDNQWTTEFIARVWRRDVQLDLEENTVSEWVPMKDAPEWIRSCPGQKCRGCLDAHNITRWRDGGPVVLLSGLAALIADTLENDILPKTNALPPLPTERL